MFEISGFVDHVSKYYIINTLLKRNTMVETLNNHRLFDESIGRTGNEVYDNYFLNLKKWLETAKEKEQVYIRECLSTAPTLGNRSTSEVNNNDLQNLHFHEFVLPPIWKRFVAEAIDFVILLIIKLYLSFIFLSTFHVELSTYKLDHYLDNPKLTFEISTELAALEVAFRVIVCFYESYWLQGGNLATPGKLYMGLKVYYVTNMTVIQARPQLIVRAHPCTPLGWKSAIFRAILKNVLVGILMFPVCLGFLFFNPYRTGYDILTKSLVVEHNDNPPRQGAM